MKKIFNFSLIFVLSLIALNVSADSGCNFTRDLDDGVTGEDVRCLQKYLNNNGYTISKDGVGSPGHETNQYKTLTQEAVAKWQKDHGLPASGFFGPASRAKFLSLIKGSTTAGSVSTSNSTSSNALIVSLTNQLLDLKAQLKNQGGTNISSADAKKAEMRIKEAVKMINDADDQIDDSNQNKESALDSLDDAKRDLFDAVVSYFDKDYKEAFDLADDSYKSAKDGYEDAGGETKEDEIDNLIDDVAGDIISAKSKINEADRDGKNVGKSEDLLDQAKDKLDEARDYLDDEDYESAEAFADEASSLVKKAVSSIGTKSSSSSSSSSSSAKSKASKAISDAKSAIKDAKNEIADADDNGDDVGDAEDYLSDANDKLDDAEVAYDDEEYSDAEDYANEAEDLANEAIDAL